MLLHDEPSTRPHKQWITERHYNAEWALSAQLEVLARQFDEMEDAYLRERKADVEQVVERLLRAGRDAATPAVCAPRRFGPARLRGGRPAGAGGEDVAPADMMQFKRSVFTGFVTDVGGRTSHTAIVARSMDIPAVVGAREASRLIRQDDWLVIDGDAGVVIVDPSPIVLRSTVSGSGRANSSGRGLDRLRHTPAVTLDGQTVELLANIELPGDARGRPRRRGGRRRPVPQRVPVHEPRRRSAWRRRAVRGLPRRRARDAGAAGDDPHRRHRRRQAAGSHDRQELRHEHGLNPALGLRAIRWSLSEPGMFRQQLRAILRASAYGRVRLLIPMVAHCSEVRHESSRRWREPGSSSTTPVAAMAPSRLAP